MGLFLETVRFELVYYGRRISTWVYFLMFFALGVFLMALFGGAFPGAQAGIMGGGNVRVNSPWVITILTSIIGLFAVLVTAALLGNAIHRDYEAGIHPLFFTAPITRASYLGGRFVGALLVNAIIFLSIPLGLLAGSLMPNLDRARFGPLQPWHFLQPYLVVVLPTLIFTGAVFFALAAVTRQMLPNYVGGVLMLVGYLLADTLTRDLDTERLASFIDPFGMRAVAQATKYWTPAEKNSQLLPLSGDFALNRLIWLGIGMLVFALLYRRFRFAHAAAERRGRAERAVPAGPRPRLAHPPRVDREFGGRAHLQQFWMMTRGSFLEIVRNRYFYAIAGAGLLFLVLAANEVGKLYGTTTWPVTYAVLEALGGTFSLFMVIIISFYAGELVWRERDVRIHQVTDATPVPTWVPLAARLAALSGVVVVLQASILAAGILTQMGKGYSNYELGLYARSLFGMQLADYLLMVALVMAVQVAVNNKYMGHLLVVLYFVFTLFMAQFGMEHNLYRYGSDPGSTYSDMNRYGPYSGPFIWFKLYWAGWALLLAVLTNLFWVRGMETGAAWRSRLARVRFRRPALAAALLAGALILGLGGFIFYNTNVLNTFRTGKQVEAATAAYERTYKRWEGRAQPRISAVDVAVDIFPEAGRASARGRYRIRNRTAVPIDTLFLTVPSEVEIRSLRLGRAAQRVHASREHGVYLYRLAAPLAPGDSTTLDFHLEFGARGFQNRVSRTEVVENGTFFNNGAFPHFGYSRDAELSDDDVRRRRKLPPRERMARPEDRAARMNNYVSGDADWMEFRATVSTSADQIALAPGYLTREWRQGGRRYFRYEMDAPILGFYAFLSARYAVKRARWNDVAIEVYHHPAHGYNVDRMIRASQLSLDYFTRNFGPYQHRQVRILEFPRYATFAQSFPNTIPYSEGIGFIARLDGPDAIDYPLYVTAHEIAHQWWAHQVIGGSVQGSTVLSETLSQYSALMVMEREYGPDAMERFLEYELDRYLAGRSLEQKKEQPLLRVENQQYIHYNKGSLVMYALRDYIGEATLNRALAEYLRAVRFQQPPYTTSLELYDRIRTATPDSLRPVVADLFERITLWDLRTRTARRQRLPNGQWRVTLDIEASKAYADSLGRESEAPVREWIDVGVFAASEGTRRGRPLYLAKHHLRSGRQRIVITVPREPARAGVDPYHKLIDRHSDDNTVDVAQ